MSGDYETLEINQPKITYFEKRSENNTKWLDPSPEVTAYAKNERTTD